MWFPLVLFVAFLTFCLAQSTPLENLLREEIYEINKEMVVNKTDVRDIKSFSLSGFGCQFDVSRGRAGNFSTTTLIGTPIFTQVNNNDGVSYHFDLTLGLQSIEVELEYKASIFSLFHSSGTTILKNKGNAVRGKGVINTYNGDHPCDAILESVLLKTFGNVDLTFKPAGFTKWLLGGSLNIFISLFRWPVTHYINHFIRETITTPEFKSKFTKMACKTFDFNI